ERGPEINGNGAQLDLGRNPLPGAAGQLHNHVIAAVAVGFWASYVVFDLYAAEIWLRGQPAGHTVDIVGERADDAHADRIVYRSQRSLAIGRQAAAAQLGDHAVRGLDA